jgi:hypothetical protein
MDEKEIKKSKFIHEKIQLKSSDGVQLLRNKNR